MRGNWSDYDPYENRRAIAYITVVKSGVYLSGAARDLMPKNTQYVTVSEDATHGKLRVRRCAKDHPKRMKFQKIGTGQAIVQSQKMVRSFSTPIELRSKFIALPVDNGIEADLNRKAEK